MLSIEIGGDGVRINVFAERCQLAIGYGARILIE